MMKTHHFLFAYILILEALDSWMCLEIFGWTRVCQRQKRDQHFLESIWEVVKSSLVSWKSLKSPSVLLKSRLVIHLIWHPGWTCIGIPGVFLRILGLENRPKGMMFFEDFPFSDLGGFSTSLFWLGFSGWEPHPFCITRISSQMSEVMRLFSAIFRLVSSHPHSASLPLNIGPNCTRKEIHLPTMIFFFFRGLNVFFLGRIDLFL